MNLMKIFGLSCHINFKKLVLEIPELLRNLTRIFGITKNRGPLAATCRNPVGILIIQKGSVDFKIARLPDFWICHGGKYAVFQGAA